MHHHALTTLVALAAVASAGNAQQFVTSSGPNVGGVNTPQAGLGCPVYDDGAGIGAGLSSGGTLAVFQWFPCLTCVTEVEFMIGCGACGATDGLPLQVCIYEDTDGNGDPNDGLVLVRSLTAPTTTSNSGTLQKFLVRPAASTPNGAFVSYQVTHPAGVFPAALDPDNPYNPGAWITFLQDMGCGNVGVIFPATQIGLPPLSWILRAKCGHSNPFGRGCGTPLSLGSSNDPVTGNNWDLVLGGVRPDSGNTVCGVMLGLSNRIDTDFGNGCILYLFPLSFHRSTTIRRPLALVPIPIPANTALLGAHGLAQGVVDDPNAPNGGLLSNGLDFYIGS